LIAVLTLPGVLRFKAVVDGSMVGFIAADLLRAEREAWIATLWCSTGIPTERNWTAVVGGMRGKNNHAKDQVKCEGFPTRQAIQLYSSLLQSA